MITGTIHFTNGACALAVVVSESSIEMNLRADRNELGTLGENPLVKYILKCLSEYSPEQYPTPDFDTPRPFSVPEGLEDMVQDGRPGPG